MAKILAMGGTHRPGSSNELALMAVAKQCESLGAQVDVFSGPDLADFPMFGTPASFEYARGRELAEAAHGADAVLIASPGYHGGISGLIKNALDYFELLADRQPTYLENKAVGVIATAYGSQAAMSTLQSLRTTVHALRGWPTPLGIAAVCSGDSFADNGVLKDEKLRDQTAILAQQLCHGAPLVSA